MSGSDDSGWEEGTVSGSDSGWEEGTRELSRNRTKKKKKNQERESRLTAGALSGRAERDAEGNIQCCQS